MINRTDPESTFPNVDIEQWRREIEVFAAATTSALDAIVFELSNACTVDGVPAVSPQQTEITKHDPVANHANNGSSAKRATASRRTICESPSTPSGSSRLALIKEKLASRMKND